MYDGLTLWLSHDPRVRAVLRRREKRMRRRALLRGVVRALAFPVAVAIVPFGVLFLALALSPGGEVSFGPCAEEVSITSTALPLTELGVPLRHSVPVEGDCPGPYRLEVLTGALPPGITLRERTLEGTPTESGVFPFRLQLTADGCEPFATDVATFVWRVHTNEEIAALYDRPRHLR